MKGELLSLGAYARRHRISRYEALRRVMRGEVEYEERVEGGKKVYYIYDHATAKKETPKKEVIECGDVRIELEGERLVLVRGGERRYYRLEAKEG